MDPVTYSAEQPEDKGPTFEGAHAECLRIGHRPVVWAGAERILCSHCGRTYPADFPLRAAKTA